MKMILHIIAINRLIFIRKILPIIIIASGVLKSFGLKLEKIVSLKQLISETILSEIFEVSEVYRILIASRAKSERKELISSLLDDSLRLSHEGSFIEIRVSVG